MSWPGIFAIKLYFNRVIVLMKRHVGLTKQELSKANGRKVLPKMDRDLGMKCYKTLCFHSLVTSCCPGSNTKDSRNIFLNILNPGPPELTGCSRIIKVFRPVLKIQGLPDFVLENLPSWPTPNSTKKAVKLSDNMFAPGETQAVQVHIHNLILTTCTPCLPLGVSIHT